MSGMHMAPRAIAARRSRALANKHKVGANCTVGVLSQVDHLKRVVAMFSRV